MLDLTCLLGLLTGFIIGAAAGIWIGMKLYWKTGHW